MKSISEIKAMARDSFRERYWLCVGILVLYALVISALSFTYVGALILQGPLVIGLLFSMIQIFMGAPCDAGTMFTKAFEDFGRKLGGYWWMMLFVFLWCLIPIAGFVIAIIKSFSYALTLNILSDCPNVRAQDALRLSIRMMRGHKWELFVMYLSFIGWGILSVLTFGILYIFWTGPYMQLSFAGYYLELREDCLRRGIITTDELDGGPVAYN